MVAAAWLLDRAAKVPNLFVEAAEFEAGKAATEPGKAWSHAGVPGRLRQKPGQRL